VTKSQWIGPENQRSSQHFEVTADSFNVSEYASTGADPVLTFVDERRIVAAFVNWDMVWEEGAVTEVWPGVAQIENRLETVPDNFQPAARPTHHKRG
jgi:hypothetical protein